MIRRPAVFVWYSLGMPSFSLSGINFFSKYINKICLLLPKESSFCSVHASCKIFTFQSPLSSLLLVKIQIYVENLTFSVVFYPLWKGDVGLGQLEHSCTLALDVSQDIFQAGEMSALSFRDTGASSRLGMSQAKSRLAWAPLPGSQPCPRALSLWIFALPFPGEFPHSLLFLPHVSAGPLTLLGEKDKGLSLEAIHTTFTFWPQGHVQFSVLDFY